MSLQAAAVFMITVFQLDSFLAWGSQPLFEERFSVPSEMPDVACFRQTASCDWFESAAKRRLQEGPGRSTFECAISYQGSIQGHGN